eukprot:scaffold885_cov381-Prasinococcus_capsulatus_cf.AAC.5
MEPTSPLASRHALADASVAHIPKLWPWCCRPSCPRGPTSDRCPWTDARSAPPGVRGEAVRPQPAPPARSAAALAEPASSTQSPHQSRLATQGTMRRPSCAGRGAS